MTKELNITGIENDLVGENNDILNRYLPLKNKKIAISVSISEDLENLGLSEQHLNDISIEIARYTISNGGITLYGGDLRVNGFTYYFSELANQYKKSNDPSIRFVNYFAPPNTKFLDRQARIEFKSRQVGIKTTGSGETGEFDVNADYKPRSKVEDRYLFCECFREMRVQMAKDCNARVLVGGKTSNFLGYIPGVIEEALTTFRESKPVYLVGGFGGATAKLINLLKGEVADELSNNYQYNDEFLKKYQEFVKDKCSYADYENLKIELLPYDIEALSKLNGLTTAENEILFTSKNIHEIVFYIMKGLKKL